MINIVFDSFGGFVLDLDVTNTGAAGGVLFDTFMIWSTLGSGEVSFVF